MIRTTKRTLAFLLAVTLILPASWLVATEKTKASAAPADERKRALHALNRLTFGPRPGEVEQVAAQGVEKWIEKQLRPESIPDKSLEARLAPFRTLKMDTRELVENFPPPQLLRAVAQGRADLPSDPRQRAIYEAALERYRERQKRQQAAGQNPPDGKSAENGMPPSREMDEAGMPLNSEERDPEERARRREARMYAELKAEEMLQLSPEKRLEEFMKMSGDERRALARALGPEERERLFAEFSPQQRETVMAMVNPGLVVTTEVQQAKILRAAYSERQLEEVMTDFWFNHFNVFINKGADRYLITAYERDVIRPRALGKFEDLLVATAESPAMMFYLDNWQSVGPKSEFAKRDPQQRGQRRMQQRGGLFGGLGRNRLPGRQRQGNDEPMQPRPQQQQQRRGLNENYARELMELHTLGVNGGYTQKDVTEVARVFTGWTIRQPRRGGGFEYNGRMHEPGDKTVLGQKISAAGKKEGAQVLRMLAQHPSTAKFISSKLAQRFVSDEPPAALVERMATTFRKSDGDVREVLRTLFRSPEFWAPEAYRAKVKTPLEFVASAVRATGAEVGNAMTLVGALNRLGMPLYAAQPPTGYSMKSEAWVNSAALLNRMNFALGLGTGRLPGITLDARQLLRGRSVPRDAEAALAVLEQSLLAGDVSRETHDTIRKQLNDPKVTGSYGADAAASPASKPGAGIVAGLLLGSPEFQRR